ncbi:DeoR/GlpR family DNA-binding transcription regulator [Exiguobacterium profundum]|uniref:DeoR/GlpR family DNA-binding transcription regulator n=1 Tax=Exiguobacterium profundum TaxID=307643 RepID=A0ABY8AVS5_9BACL|nr:MULTISPECIES: DeoR/GlpR family DNA-binding transcription regulator [Exiguobacterium]MCT4799081.1 DeoR/GlpR family DNA-binding transcription regulator [Exiguobacterium profundum]WED53997.1 DeoR/GlpR family DNA-binding transcription regulator [Exiguobacterium profundum]VXB16871.1 transcriptional regulator (DeoR family) [Exiguobacterium sp. 8H]VXB18363.1 transcriptional regulator (DeoR family) [Exiguobacterium sp. 8A]
MLTKQRHQLILQRLSEQKVVKLKELVDLTDSSESTIRRDLTDLEAEGYLARVHGGATLIATPDEEPTFEEKRDRFVDEKVAIARKAATFIEDGMSIYLDAGTTTQAMVPFLEGKKIVVVTNSLPIANELFDLDIKTFVIGGELKRSTQALVGYNARESMMNYRVDLAFLGMNGIDLEAGYTTPDPEEALVKKTAIELAQTSFVLADASKIGKRTFSRVATLDAAQLITSSSESMSSIQTITKVVNAK